MSSEPARLKTAWVASPTGRGFEWLLSSLAALEPRVERGLRGPLWVPLAAMLALLLAVVFSHPGFGTNSAKFLERIRPGWSQVVQLKLDDPLHDMSSSFEEGSNQAKRTFRLTAPAVGYATRAGLSGTIVFEYACAYAVLHSAVLLGWRLLGTRSAGFFAALLLASTYFGTAVLKTGAFFWYDSVSYGLLLLAMNASGSATRALALFAACFSDERALFVAPLTLVQWGATAEQRRAFRREVLATLAGTGAYLAVRIWLSVTFGLRTATQGIGLGPSDPVLHQAVACLWAPFEGGWLLLAVGAVALLAKPWPGRGIARAGFAFFGAYVLSCFLVGDVTRSMAFACVAFFPLLKALTLRLDIPRVRATLMLASLVSLLVPNLFAGNDVTVEISLFAWLLGAR
ncbi:MAG: hypothetical protein NDJ94_18850 [Vicinamibacteria bacterium]|nr:hypothetical protein [Vicinamibacteria bacterium]